MGTSTQATLLGVIFSVAGLSFAAPAPLMARGGHETGCSKPHETSVDQTLEVVGATPEDIRKLNAKSKTVRYIPVPVPVPVADQQATADAQQRGFVLGLTLGRSEGEEAVCKKIHREVSFCETP